MKDADGVICLDDDSDNNIDDMPVPMSKNNSLILHEDNNNMGEQSMEIQSPIASLEKMKYFVKERQPFCFSSLSDVIILLAYNDPEIVQTKVQKKMLLFCHDICAYKNSTVVSKHCGPWGQRGALFERSFIVVKKMFNYEGKLTSILLRDEFNGDEFLIDSQFFHGWADGEAIRKYNDY